MRSRLCEESEIFKGECDDDGMSGEFMEPVAEPGEGKQVIVDCRVIGSVS